MRNLIFIVLGFLIIGCHTLEQVKKTKDITTPIVLVIHGGAGNINPENLSNEKEYQQALNEALEAGYEVLESGGTALEAVEIAIAIMEDSPLFNAGKGAVFNHYGQNELDASVMDGSNLKAGAVTGLMRVKNPISAALAVMRHSKHVMLSGDGAEEFCKEQGLQMVDPSYFYTEKQYNRLIEIQNKEIDAKEEKKGTVGAVALDKNGNIVAGTSTGGMTDKKYGRIGDSPIIGAGTYADNNTCGISCTGTGEYFIRTVAAHEVSNLMQYQDLNLQQAQKKVIEKIGRLGGDGGMIGVDKKGNVAWFFNTQGMFRAYKKSNGAKEIRFYGI